jgi:hypothetical protein
MHFPWQPDNDTKFANWKVVWGVSVHGNTARAMHRQMLLFDYVYVPVNS